MKIKTISLVLSFLVLSVLVNNAHATSGVCSWHGGVNCSLKWSSVYVVCNDGWESSEVYSQMVECNEQPIPQCFYPSYYGCQTEEDYQQLKNRLWASSAASRLPYPDESTNPDLLACRKSIDDYTKAIAAYNQCMIDAYSYNPATGQIVYTPTPTPVNFNQVCQKNFGQYSREAPEKPGYCSCIEGYGFDSNDQCVSQEAYCRQKYGEKAQSIDRQGTCGCLFGYQFNSSRTACVASTPTPPIIATPTFTPTIAPTPKPTVKKISPSPIIKSLPKLTETPTAEIISNPMPELSTTPTPEPVMPKQNWFIRLLRWLF